MEQGHARVVVARRRQLREVPLRHLHHLLVDVHQHHPLHVRVPQHLPADPPIPTPHDQDVRGGREVVEGDVGEHLVVGALVALGEHEVAVDEEDLAEGARLQHGDVLVGARDLLHQALRVEGQRDAELRVLRARTNPLGL